MLLITTESRWSQATSEIKSNTIPEIFAARPSRKVQQRSSVSLLRRHQYISQPELDLFLQLSLARVIGSASQLNRWLRSVGCERSIKIKLKIKKTYFENKSNAILKIKDLAAKIK